MRANREPQPFAGAATGEQRIAAKEAPAAATAAIAPLMVAPTAVNHHPPAIPLPLLAITPPPSLTSTHSNSGPFDIPITPTTPGIGIETVATEAHVDSGVFGATPTYNDGDSIAVEPAVTQS